MSMGGSAPEEPLLTSMDTHSAETMEAPSGTWGHNAGSVAAEMVDFINAAWTPFHAVRKCNDANMIRMLRVFQAPPD